MPNLFEEIRQRVPMKEAALRYGFEPDRHDKICCPFHEDKHPSLQLYSGERGWWCYVCGLGGSVIDFVAKLFGLSPREAALKLNADFALGLSGERPRILEQRAQNHSRLLQEREVQKFHLEYEARQREFVELRQELSMIPKGGRAGEIMGRMGVLEEWFRENPWR